MAHELAAGRHLEAPALRSTMNTATEAHQVAVAESEQEVILRALRILRARFKQRDVFANSDAVKAYLRLQGQGLEHEVFAVMYLDAHHRLLDYERMFRGSLTQTAVYPREVVKQALTMNAASVVLHHSVARHKMMLMYPDPLCVRLRRRRGPPSRNHRLRGT